ncbi:MAG: hypothetical protein GC151_11490 [Betaproteobacteria bacterium]|nr:hypothetical protein [Betaproteobacteria bacterium]
MRVRKRCLVSLTLSIAGILAGPAAHAQLRASVGSEFFSWTEDTSPEVRERGGLLAFTLEYTQRRDRGLLGAYRGKLYFGSVHYEGAELFPPFTPVVSTTEYLGTSQEAQARYRFAVGQQRAVDIVAGLGVDLWERKLSASQKEDYVIGYGRLGVETERDGEGWIVGAGIKYPFYTWEDAHLTDIGFLTNPTLTPGKDVSPYLQVGYRFDPMAVIFYVDSFRFSQSAAEPVTHATQGPQYIYQPASTRYSAGLRLRFDFQ